MQKVSLLILAYISLCCSYCIAQNKFKIQVKNPGGWSQEFDLLDEDGKCFKKLDTAKYLICFNPNKYVHFAIVGMKRANNEGWAAIDANENILFWVYNTSPGEPSPDDLRENSIRIVGPNNLIGFANTQGEVIITPQFEMASSFYQGKAIIGKGCKKVPWHDHVQEGGCNHFSIICDENGYIDRQGNIQKIGRYTFEEIMNEIKWKPED